MTATHDKDITVSIAGTAPAPRTGGMKRAKLLQLTPEQQFDQFKAQVERADELDRRVFRLEQDLLQEANAHTATRGLLEQAGAELEQERAAHAEDIMALEDSRQANRNLRATLAQLEQERGGAPARPPLHTITDPNTGNLLDRDEVRPSAFDRVATRADLQDLQRVMQERAAQADRVMSGQEDRIIELERRADALASKAGANTVEIRAIGRDHTEIHSRIDHNTQDVAELRGRVEDLEAGR